MDNISDFFEDEEEEEEILQEIRKQREQQPSDESGVDWELSLSLETTLQLIEEESLTSSTPVDENEVLLRVLDVCRGRGGVPSHLRGKVWLILLSIFHEKSTSLVEIFDLKDQHVIRKACGEFVKSSIASDNEQSTQSKLETLLTTYYKRSGEENVTEEGLAAHLQLLKPLLTLSIDDADAFRLFKTILTHYIPRDVGNPHGLPFHIFRLILLYHEPEVCNVLDSLRIKGHDFAHSWFSTLLSGDVLEPETVLVLWDVYFQYRDPFLLFHMALVLVLNAKDSLLELNARKSETAKSEAIELLKGLPSGLTPADVTDFLTLSNHYALQTPVSYRRLFESALFGSDSLQTIPNSASAGTSPCRRVAMNSLCMPVSAEELLSSIRNEGGSGNSTCSSDSNNPDAFVKFFVVDCRPHQMYNSGHLPTAFHLDCGLMLSEPVQFSTAVQGLLLAQKEALSVGSAAGGEHLCFVGSGREEEDQYVHMVVASFLQRHVPKVGLLSGGYQALHYLLSTSSALEAGLADHDVTECPECLLDKQSTSSSKASPLSGKSESGDRKASAASAYISKFSLFSTQLKAKSSEMKEKLIELMQNTSVTSPTSHESPLTHVKSADREKSKPYRNLLPVFMIDDDPDPEDLPGGICSKLEDLQVGSRIPSLKGFLKKHGSWACSEVHSDGSHNEGYLVLSEESLYFILEDGEDGGSKGEGVVGVMRLLSSVIKITSKKKHPHLITFKYGCVVGEEASITHSDRFFLNDNPKAFVEAVKKLIDQK